MTTIGILGAGQLAELMVRGLQGTDYRFVLSPRGAKTAARLAETYGCEVAASNQEVVDRSEGVFVALPAARGMEEVSRLRFRPGQPVLSAMAGTRAHALSPAIGPACGDIAMMPGYANALRIGPSILFPGAPFWRAFLGQVGPVLVLESEEQFIKAAAFGLVLTTNTLTVLMSFAALAITLAYPYAKRFVSMPQAVLGVAFSFGVPMAFAAVQAQVPPLAWVLLLGNLFWVLAYDTEYAMVDRDDDLKIGIQTSAITLGRWDG